MRRKEKRILEDREGVGSMEEIIFNCYAFSKGDYFNQVIENPYIISMTKENYETIKEKGNIPYSILNSLQKSFKLKGCTVLVTCNGKFQYVYFLENNNCMVIDNIDNHIPRID